MNKMELQGDILGIGRYQIPLSSFPHLFVAYASANSSFMGRHFRLEQQGDEWCERGIPDKEVEGFFRAVCTWGDANRPLMHVFGEKDGEPRNPDFIQKCQDAFNLAKDGNLSDAIGVLDSIYGVDISVGSKQLRMMFSRNCVALDSILQIALPYESTHTAYENFCNDCVQVAEILDGRGVKFPQKALEKICHEYGIAETTIRPEWRAADVEAALFLRAFRNP